MAISDWTITEVSSAMAKKLRERQITPPQRAAALAMFNGLVEDSFIVLQVTREHFRAAARLIDQSAIKLLSGDALHLATASEHDAAVYTLDSSLADAGRTLGIPTQLLV